MKTIARITAGRLIMAARKGNRTVGLVQLDTGFEVVLDHMSPVMVSTRREALRLATEHLG